MRVRTMLFGIPSHRRLLVVAASLLLLPLEVQSRPVSYADDRDVELASVADLTITADAFRFEYVRYLLATGLGDTPPLRTRFLQRMIEDRLLAQEALRLGAADEPEYRITEERHRRKLLLDLWVRRTLYDSVQVSEEDLRDAFLRANTSVRARHLYARTAHDADRLYQRLQAGATFEDLATEVFSDSALAHSGGDLGWFSFDEMDPAFEDAAFALPPGAISRPVRTTQGYSIIRVEERTTHPLLTEPEYARRRDKLATYVINRKRVLARRAYVQQLLARLDLTLDDRALSELHRQIQGTFVAPDDEARQDWLARPLLHFQDDGQRFTWTIDDFRREAGFTDPEQRAQVRTKDDLRDFVEGIVVRQRLLARAHAAGLHEDPDLRPALDEAMTAWLAAAARARITEDLTADEATRALHTQIDVLRRRFDVEVRLDRLNSLALSANGAS